MELLIQIFRSEVHDNSTVKRKSNKSTEPLLS
jgi:hypothetical protein